MKKPKRVPAWKRIEPWTPEWIAYLRKENHRGMTNAKNSLRRLDVALDHQICEEAWYIHQRLIAEWGIQSAEVGSKIIDLNELEMLGLATQEDLGLRETLMEKINELTENPPCLE